jgi:hypothetical protein
MGEMKRLLILEGWNSFRREVLPAEAPPIQIEECRRAFYAGCVHLFSSIIGILEPGAEPTDNDLRQMQAVDDEIRAFGAEMLGLAVRMAREKKS